MDTDKRSKPTRERDEFEIAYYTKELGRGLQRKLLQQKLESTGSNASAAHGEDRSGDRADSPPPEDRAG